MIFTQAWHDIPLVVVLLNVVATYMIFFAPASSPSAAKYVLQLAFVWLVPIAGAVLLALYLIHARSKKRASRPSTRDTSDGSWNGGVDYNTAAYSGGYHSNSPGCGHGGSDSASSGCSDGGGGDGGGGGD